MAPRPGESRVTLANNQKLRKTFGWEPTIKLEEWIAKNI
jgi:nucleoside-diphosphate-sugar epimerase